MSGKKLLDLHNVYHQSSRTPGQLRILDTGLGWKCTDERVAVVTFPGREVKSAHWQRVARGWQLRIVLYDPRDSRKDGSSHLFEGLKREDLEVAKKAIQETTNSEVELEVKEVSLKGWNWGKADVKANELAFLVQQRTAFEVPLAKISNSNMAGKNEIALEFTTPENAAGSSSKPDRMGDELVEMRFYIPQRTGRKGRQDSEGGSDQEEEEDEDEDVEYDEDGNEITPAEAFHKAITEHAELGEQAGDAIVTFSDVSVVTPRGRYEIEMHAEHLRLHGKTYDYKILYKHIHRLFLLPRADQMYNQLIVGIEPPIRQGQTKYPWLVMQWDLSEETDLTLNIEDDVLEKEYPGMAKDYSAPTYEITANLFKRLARKPITGTGSFTGAGGTSCVKANVKAMQGELHLLDKCLIFVAKSPILAEFSKITKAVMTRATGVLRSFDLLVKMSTEVEHTFTSINKDEYDGVKAFLSSKGIRLKESGGEEVTMRTLDNMDLDDDDEDDAESSDAGARKKAPRAVGGDDEESEEDEDFQSDSAPSSPDDSNSDSDSDAGAQSDVTDDMVNDAKTKSKSKSKPNGSNSAKAAPKGNGKAKPTAKSKETIDDDDEDDAMDVDEESDNGEPKKKKQKTG